MVDSGIWLGRRKIPMSFMLIEVDVRVRKVELMRMAFFKMKQFMMPFNYNTRYQHRRHH